jgi:hypothetical protein
MNRDEAIKARKIIQAWLDGEEIECRREFNGDWEIIHEPNFNFARLDYRIKPEKPEPDPSEIVGRKIKNKENGEVELIISSQKDKESHRYVYKLGEVNKWFTYTEILDDYEFVD